YDFWIDDGIWLWEEVGEEPYRIDRMLTHLRLSGRFEKIRGVVVGKLKNCGGEEELGSLLRAFFAFPSIPVVGNLAFGPAGESRRCCRISRRGTSSARWRCSRTCRAPPTPSPWAR